MSKDKKHRYFDPKMKSRAWVVTMHIAVLRKIGFTEEEIEKAKNDLSTQKMIAERVEEFIKESLNAEVALVICISAEGLFHLHIAIYTQGSTTLKHVADCLLGCHTEPQLAKKSGLLAYLQKTGEYEEKGEMVLYEYNLEKIKDGRTGKGSRPDLEEIKLMLETGATPKQIFERDMRYRNFEKIIVSEYTAKRIKDAPLVKDMYCEWHCGESGSGKSFAYIGLCEKYGRENIYFMNDFLNGGLDSYMEKGCPKILFMDEVKPEDISFRQILMLTDVYSDAQTHSRFRNTINLWDRVYVTSIYSIEDFYKELVSEEKRKTESFEQLRRRFHKVVYHYKNSADEYKQIECDMKNYKSINHLIDKALVSEIRVSDKVAKSLDEFSN